MRSRDIRERFLHFFADRGHRRLPSASLVPPDDPSVLFTVAGMIPFKGYLTGRQAPPFPRAATCQKCFRTGDIEEVGRTPRHVTFFEMLGNFSFGDYFKETAIPYAWELLTGDLGLPAARLWPSIHPGDTVAHDLWTGMIGVPDERVVRLEDNFWEMGRGLPGPCGYDSEVHWDLGGRCSCGQADCRPGCDGDRWMELWNLVFMEFDRDGDGVLHPLPRASIDTGMGIERLALVLQGTASIFGTDLFSPLVAGFEGRSRTDLPPRERTVALRICADHVRAAVFLVADGVLPGNEGRGYVLRRIIRRAQALAGRRLGLRDGLAGGIGDVIAAMGDAHPELAPARPVVEQTIRAEEAAFSAVLETGVERLERLLASGVSPLSGEDAFRLHDTHGFPLELTVEIAAERGVEVDRAGFEAQMAAQRERSGARSSRVTVADRLPDLPPTRFVGYDSLQAPAGVVRLGAGGELLDSLERGEEADVLLDPSPFYAEAGGQVGDTGALEWEGGRAEVLDTRPAASTQARLHHVRVERGRLVPGAQVLATVDAPRRSAVSRHHTATHLLHRALRDVLGETAVQRGSLVAPDHLTFDFAFGRALDADELREVERRVNSAIRSNLARQVELLSLEEARATGAVALFGERYGEMVRVVDFGGWARELCGGTHVGRSGDVGAAIIASESGIGQGLRRVAMVAGDAAEERWRESGQALQRAARVLRVRPEEVPERIEGLQAQLRRLTRELDEARRGGGGDRLAAVRVEELDGLRLAHLVVDGELGAREVDGLADRVFAERLGGEGVAVVLGPASLAVKVGAGARASGADAGALARQAAEATGGRGGGRPDFARGGVGDAGGRGRALAVIRRSLVGR